jgi:hypothetical protein
VLNLRGFAFLTGAILFLMPAGCRAAAPVLFDVAVEPSAITPNQDGDADVTRITYGIGVPATITVTLHGRGEPLVLRAGKRRSPERYEALFGGVIEGAMLADGEYTVQFSAVPRDGGPTAIVTRTLRVSEADSEPPGLYGFTVQPAVLSPNQDGLGDEVVVSYRLDDAADVRVTLVTEDGDYVTDVLEEEASASRAGEPGPHAYVFDAGVEANAQPPPDGTYRVVAEARDGVGNVTHEERVLEIVDGGLPNAALFGDVVWSSHVVALGQTLAFTSTVRNVGDTPIRTRGPEPGAVYENTSTFNTTPPAGFVLLAKSAEMGASAWVAADATGDVTLELATTASSAGVPLGGAGPPDAALPARVTVCGNVVQSGLGVEGAEVTAFEVDGDGLRQVVTDAEGRFCFEALPVPAAHERSYARSPGALRLGLEYDEKRTDLEYPFRWQLGLTSELDTCESDDRLYLCLLPGKEVDVFGGVRFTEPPFRRGTNVYLALMHEDVRRMHGPYGIQHITVEFE